MMRVLVADDEIRVCKLICNLVDWSDYDMQIVGVAHDGLQVLDMIEKHKPHLVVTDIRMPSMDGLETIRQVKRAHPDIDFIIISGYRDFEYAQTAIKYGVGDYLLKPLKKDELSTTLKRLKQRWHLMNEQLSREEELRFRLENDIEALRSGFFRDVLLVEERAKFTIDSANQSYHFKFQPGLFQAFTIKMDAAYPDDLSENGLHILKGKLTKLLRDNFKEACFEGEMYFSRCWVYGILNYTAGAKEDVKRRFSACMDELTVLRSLYKRMEFTIGLGSPESDISDAPISLRHAIAAAQHRLIAMTSRVMQDAPKPVLNRNKLLSEFKAELSGPVELLDSAQAGEAVNHLRDTVCSTPGVTGQEVFALVIEAYELYLVTKQSYKKEMNAVRDEMTAFESQAEYFGHAHELFSYLRDTIIRSIAEQYEQRSLALTRPIRKAKQYIQEHYMEPISLEEVSGIVAFNTSYFSTLFKKECGVNFMEYLSQTRVDKAKELLRDTQLSIADICCSVGYLDIKHFNKTFKRYVSVSPLEFRKLYS